MSMLATKSPPPEKCIQIYPCLIENGGVPELKKIKVSSCQSAVTSLQHPAPWSLSLFIFNTEIGSN